MAYNFGTIPWHERIAQVSTRPEFQRAVIRIFDESQAVEVEPWNIDTNEGPVYEGGDVYQGQARIIGVRWGVQSGGESQANATTISAIRVQIPRGATGRVRKGCKVFVESAPNLVLSSYIFTVTSDMQGSSDAARTFECSLDIDVERTDG